MRTRLSPARIRSVRRRSIFCARPPLPASKVVPIRPGAADALAPRESQAAGDSVELSRSERDAFREIARALVGRPQALRQDGDDEPPAPDPEEGDAPDEASGDPFSPPSPPEE